MIKLLYQQLLQEYGDPARYWPQWCALVKSDEDREKIIMGTILVQRTTWHNANLALKNLKSQNLLSIKKIAELISLDQLTSLIRSAGFYQSKPQRLYDICAFISDQGGVSQLKKLETSELRSDLLKIKGVGPETADTILLYSLDKPVFIIDEYTRRWTQKNQLSSERDYLKLQKIFEENLFPDFSLYQKFHALIIISQRGPKNSLMENI